MSSDGDLSNPRANVIHHMSSPFAAHAQLHIPLRSFALGKRVQGFIPETKCIDINPILGHKFA